MFVNVQFTDFAVQQMSCKLLFSLVTSKKLKPSWGVNFSCFEWSCWHSQVQSMVGWI